jgi:hypothetical protein
MRTVSLLLLLPALCLPAAALADEVLVPWQAQGNIESFDSHRAAQMGVLSEYPDLVEARLYQEDTSNTYTLEVVQRVEGRTVRKRVPLTAEEAEGLRMRVATGLAATKAAEAAPPLLAHSRVQQSDQARAALLATSTAFGLGLYSWGIPTGLSAPSAPAAVGVGLLSAGASFFVPFWLTRETEVSWGTVNTLFGGMSRGAAHGLLLSLSLSPPTNSFNPLLPMSLMSLAEGVGGALWASHYNISAGTARAMTNFHDFGAGYAVVLLLLTSPPPEPRLLAGSAFAGGVVGATAGYFIASSRGYTWSETEAITTAGALGAYLVAPVASFFPQTDTRVWTTSAVFTSAGAMVLADMLLRGKGLTGVSGLFVNLGTSAGALAGLGIGFLVAPQDRRWALTVGALGAVGGYIASAALMIQPPKVALNANVHVRVDPTALALLSSGSQGSQPQGRRRPQVPPPPVVALEGSF